MAAAQTQVSKRLFDFVRGYEGKHDGNKRTPQWEPELCPANIWTVGWGHVLVVNGRQLKGEEDRELAMAEYKRRWPNGLFEAEADELLRGDLTEARSVVSRNVRVPLTDSQIDALTSFVFNVGPGGKGVKDGFITLKSGQQSTMFRKLQAGDYGGTGAEFAKWNKGGGKVLAGLVRRRAAEAKMFLDDDPEAKSAPMPQLVEPTGMKPLGKSRTMIGGSVAGAAATVAATAEAVKPALEQVKGLQGVVAQLSPWVVVAILAAGLGYVLWRRFLDSRESLA